MRAFLVAVALTALLAAGALWVLPRTELGASAAASPTEGQTPEPPPATATAVTGDLTSRKELAGRVSHGEAWPLAIQASGTVTRAPEAGEQVGFGDELVRIAEAPVFLAEGTMPMYRPLALSDSARTRLRGPDVTQLQQFLVAAEVPEAEELDVDGVFGPRTHRAVRAWQASVGLPRTGSVDAGQLVFEATPLRISGADRAGAPFTALEVTDRTQTVEVTLSGRDRTLLSEGQDVTILTPDGEVDGAVTQVRAAVIDGQRQTTARVEPGADLPEGLEEVTVVAERTLASEAVLVPASALVALADTGYAVELAGSRSLTRVEIGAVLDGQVEITSGLEADQLVVVAP